MDTPRLSVVVVILLLLLSTMDTAQGQLTFPASVFHNGMAIKLVNPVDAVVPIQGDFLYAAGSGSASIVRWNRNAMGGLSAPLTYTNNTVIPGPSALALAPDGTTLYLASRMNNAIVAFPRDTVTGDLDEPISYVHNASQAVVSGPGVVLENPKRVVVSPDGASLYAVSSASDSIVSWHRDNATGELSNAMTLVHNGATLLMEDPGAVVVSPEGTHVYVVAATSGVSTLSTLVKWDRNSSTSHLSNAVAYTSALWEEGNDILISPDGRFVYTSDAAVAIVVAWPRTVASGVLGTAAPAFTGTTVTAMAISSSGLRFYTVHEVSNEVQVWERNTNTGTFANPVAYADNGNTQRLLGPQSVFVTDDGVNVYTASSGSDAVVKWVVQACFANPCANGGTCGETFPGYACACVAGWGGTECTLDVDECASSPCLNGGTCSTPVFNAFECACAASYSGPTCAVGDPCASAPCQNGATCNAGVGSYTCTCATGFEGTECEGNVDECATSPCDNGATCHDGINSYQCECPPGYDGATCAPCSGNTFSTGGVGASCAACTLVGACGGCDAGTGLCNDCPAGQEPNGGTGCANCAPNFFSNSTGAGPCEACIQAGGCTGCEATTGDCDECPAGYEPDGSTGCNACTGNTFTSSATTGTCQACSLTGACTLCDPTSGYCTGCPLGLEPNGGTGCVACAVNSYSDQTDDSVCSSCVFTGGCLGCDATTGLCNACLAGSVPDGSTGCVDINECASSPCLNGATCNNLANAYTCTCAATWTGAECQTSLTLICSSVPCDNGGTCVGMGATFSCVCTAEWTGSTCSVDVNECAASPCQNGATCSNTPGSFTCGCPPGYEGVFCQTDIDECALLPCLNGGTCTEPTIGTWACSCRAGYVGTDCSFDFNDCAASPCQNGATCVDAVNDYTCTCVGGFSGVDCDVNIDDCMAGACQNGGTCNDGVGSFSCTCPSAFTGALCDTPRPEDASGGGTVAAVVGSLFGAGAVVAGVFFFQKRRKEHEFDTSMRMAAMSVEGQGTVPGYTMYVRLLGAEAHGGDGAPVEGFEDTRSLVEEDLRSSVPDLRLEWIPTGGTGSGGADAIDVARSVVMVIVDARASDAASHAGRQELWDAAADVYGAERFQNVFVMVILWGHERGGSAIPWWKEKGKAMKKSGEREIYIMGCGTDLIEGLKRLPIVLGRWTQKAAARAVGFDRQKGALAELSI